MKKPLLLLLGLIMPVFCYSQVVINEIDTDTPSTDLLEFIELKSATPNMSLNGYVLAFFNGGTDGLNNEIYYKISLNGLVTDANGLVVIGNQAVSPVPDRIISNSTIQNGADFVGLYNNSSLTDFTDYMPITNVNLVDYIVYTKSNGDGPQAILNALTSFGYTPVAYNENASGRITQHSLQRQNDGSFIAANPTPFRLNDGSGINIPTLTINAPTNHLTEGNTFTFSVVSSQVVTENLTIEISLNNNNFNNSDYSGNLNLVIPQGQTTASTTITLLNDGITEGDEELKIAFSQFPVSHKKANDEIIIRVLDANIFQQSFGRPTNPTYNIVQNTIPEGYYDRARGLTGENLRIALQQIISDENIVRKHTYGDVVEILNNADQDPENSSNVWLMYKEVSRPKLDYQGSESSSTGRWNREHIYPQSRGGFTNATETYSDGINIWDVTNSADISAGHSDAHHIRPEDGPENSSRSNQNFGPTEYNGFIGNLGSWKGDVARAIFYMATRYQGLNVDNGYPANQFGRIGDLTSLLSWHTNDPSDDYEMYRNNYIYTWQYNRNPYIDHPELVSYIWGNNVGQAWNPTLSNPNYNLNTVKLYPNPSANYFKISGIATGKLQVFNATGMVVLNSIFTENVNVSHNLPAGIYFVKITANGNDSTYKIIVK